MSHIDKILAPGSRLHESCQYDEQCTYRDLNTFCYHPQRPTRGADGETSETVATADIEARCLCKPGFHATRDIAGSAKSGTEVCLIDSVVVDSVRKRVVSSAEALCIGLSILVLLLCLMFRIFTRAHRESRRVRRFADANECPVLIEDRPTSSTPPPSPQLRGVNPTIMLSKDQVASDQHPISSPHLSLRRQHSLDIERQLYRPIFCSAASAPGSRNSSLGGGGGSLAVSGGCVEGALKTLTSVSVPPEIRRGSGGATHFCQDWPQGFTDSDSGDIEQHITIVPNPRSKQRADSMADYAFPELHSAKSRTSKQEPENLLILTRTRTDRHGRRHSVAVPLIPPPDGEKFEGGYYVERNPITGGAKLVAPSGASSAEAVDKGRERRRPSRERLQRSSSGRGPTSLNQGSGNATGGSSTAQPRPRSFMGMASSRRDLLSTPASMVSDGAIAPRSMKRAASMRERSSATKERESGSWSASSGMGRAGTQPRSRTIANMPTIGESRLANHMQSAQEGSERGAGVAPSVAVDKESGYIRRLSLQPASGDKCNSTGHTPRKGQLRSLSRDMDRMKLSSTASALGVSPPKTRDVSPRPLKRRSSSRRSSSRSKGFLHFLDLAIAN